MSSSDDGPAHSRAIGPVNELQFLQGAQSGDHERGKVDDKLVAPTD